MKITLSRTEIAGAILHNNETVSTGGDEMGVFVWPDGSAEVSAVGRGTYYTGPDIYDPKIFVNNIPSDDTTQWWNGAREERIKEGKVRDVEIIDNLTPEEHELIQEYADLYDQVWREELRYPAEVELEGDDGSFDIIEIEWTD
ncbi:MAG: hypothetical protein PHX88_11340 [Methanoculleus horonobensis]|jgi:hypothetical protein|nr:hypothetical protein [Methanoculleus horonobensis]